MFFKKSLPSSEIYLVLSTGVVDDLPLLHNVEKKTINQIAALLVASQQSHASCFHIFVNFIIEFLCCLFYTVFRNFNQI